MARLQILELPEGSDDDRPPFVLVIDQYVPLDVGPTLLREPIPQRYQGFAEQIGARAVLVFEETIDIPGNDVPVDETGHPIKFRIEPDFETFREQVQDEIRKTQAELKQAVNRDAATERTDIARETGRLANLKAALLDALGMDPASDWDDIRNAAAGLRKDRDANAEAIERVRSLPPRPNTTDPQYPEPNSYQHGYQTAIEAACNATWTQPNEGSTPEKQSCPPT